MANLLDDTQSYQGYHIYLCVIHTMSVVSSVDKSFLPGKIGKINPRANCLDLFSKEFQADFVDFLPENARTFRGKENELATIRLRGLVISPIRPHFPTTSTKIVI